MFGFNDEELLENHFRRLLLSQLPLKLFEIATLLNVSPTL
jgi:hypothetical protein